MTIPHSMLLAVRVAPDPLRSRPAGIDRRWFAILFCAIVLAAAAVRLIGLASAGVIYQDDLRAYSGVAVVRDLAGADSVPLLARLASADHETIDGTGARPALAWMFAIPASLGARRAGQLFLPVALCGVAVVALTMLLLRGWLGGEAALLGGAWLALSGAAVNYSRSGLPPMPGMLAMVLGLYLLIPRPADRPTVRGTLGCGIAFAVAVMFHPAYLLYLGVPIALLLAAHRRQSDHTTAFGRGTAARLALLIAPTPALIALYDLPALLVGLRHGTPSAASVPYLSGLLRLSHSPTVYGLHEGVTFWPRSLIAAEGALGAVILAAFVLAALARGDTDAEGSRDYLLIWLVVPWLCWLGWLNVNSFGRLYAPMLVPLAGLAGLGAERVRRLLTCYAGAAGPAAAGTVAAVAIPGLLASARIIGAPGPTPQLAAFVTHTLAADRRPPAVIAFERTDRAMLASVPLITAYEPEDVREAFCSGRSSLLALTAGSYYLALRHHDFLARGIRLAPLLVQPNPYAIPARLYDGQTPAERALVRSSATARRLGLFRIKAVIPGCTARETIGFTRPVAGATP